MDKDAVIGLNRQLTICKHIILIMPHERDRLLKVGQPSDTIHVLPPDIVEKGADYIVAVIDQQLASGEYTKLGALL